MIPVGGATKQHPALFVVPGKQGKPAVAIISSSTPDPSRAAGGPVGNQATGTSTPTPSTASSPSALTPATAFPSKLPGRPGPGGTQALAENTTNGGVLYDVSYAVVTVSGGAPVTKPTARSRSPTATPARPSRCHSR